MSAGDDAVPDARPATDLTQPGNRWRLLAVGVVVLALIATTATLAVFRHTDTQTAHAYADAASAARDATAAILSYRPDTVADDLAEARTHLTGEFATYFDRLGTEVVLPAARQRHMSTTATVSATSVVSATDDHAVALVFANQSTTADDLPQPKTLSSSLRVELRKVDGTWLVSKFDPV
ncbi:hypothetical protein [Nocardia callitridis]|uniref:Twin-arginine translocation pathway signal n=1 Tax=Nocardia callitridis TaxID=648753 RepID=A0ABP9KCP6_9NOCA